MNVKDLILNFKDALLLLNVHIIGPKKSKLSACGLHTDALALLIFLCSTIQKIDIMETKDAEHELSKKKDAEHEQRLDLKF